MVAARPLILEPDAPQWARKLVNDLEGAYVKALPSRPTKLPAFAVADLPPASDWRECLVYVTDRTCCAVSTGSAWVKTDGSAL